MNEPTDHDSSSILCKGTDPMDGCGSRFPNKTMAGLCSKCKAIEQRPELASAYKVRQPLSSILSLDVGVMMAFQELPQCVGCGAIGRNLVPPYCVPCNKPRTSSTTPPLEPPSPTIAPLLPGPQFHNPQIPNNPQIVSDPAADRARSMSHNFASQMLAAKKAKAAGSSIDGTSSKSNEMLAFRNSKLGLLSRSRLITVNCWLATGSKGILPWFPSESKIFKAEDTMYGALFRSISC